MVTSIIGTPGYLWVGGFWDPLRKARTPWCARD
jgi:hypothetical protein